MRIFLSHGSRGDTWINVYFLSIYIKFVLFYHSALSAAFDFILDSYSFDSVIVFPQKCVCYKIWHLVIGLYFFLSSLHWPLFVFYTLFVNIWNHNRNKSHHFFPILTDFHRVSSTIGMLICIIGQNVCDNVLILSEMLTIKCYYDKNIY